MRYHHGYGCYGHGGWHGGCDPGPGHYGWEPGFGYGWDWPADDPRPYWRRGRPGFAAARPSTAAQLESYLASLRDEIRAIEQDLRDLAAGESDDAGKERT